MSDLITEWNQCISGSNLFNMDFFPQNVFDLMALIIDTIPAMWQRLMKMKGCVDKEPVALQDQIELV